MKQYSPINRKRLLSSFVDLVRIDSPSFKEKKIGDYLAQRLSKAGCSVRFQDYKKSFNLIATLKGKKSCCPLMLSAHMDTIEPTAGISFAIDSTSVRTTGNTVLGSDDKSALAQILEVVTVLGERDIPHGDIEIVFSSAEETGLVGARNLDFNRIRSRHALVLDSGGSVGNLVVGAPTHLRYKITVTGKSAHAGMEPEKGISSIRVASAIITSVPDGRIDNDTTANIGIIEGGTATNVVPKITVIQGELRSHCRNTLLKTKKKIFDNARLIARQHGARLTIEHEIEYLAFRVPKTNPFLKYLSGVYMSLGIEPSLVRTGGGSDANIFHQHGIMAINISNGMQNVHSPEEFILLDDLYKGCEIALRAVQDFRLEAPVR
jgi:tripeptide aminopeptidase